MGKTNRKLSQNKAKAVVWPGKNHKYFKKRKSNIEFQAFFLYNILPHFYIKML